MNHRIAAALLAAWLPLAALAQAPSAEGEVTKVDKAAARVTIKHRGVKNLDMPPMTMSFHVADGRTLDGLAPGDKVRFAADRVNGNFTVTTLQKAP